MFALAFAGSAKAAPPHATGAAPMAGFPANPMAAADQALFIRAALKDPKPGKCAVFSADAGFANEMLVRPLDDGTMSAPEKRVALVIGNGAYGGLPPLRNPSNDAKSVARLLQAMGFTVHVGFDLKEAASRACLDAFYRDIEGAPVALLYYAGHGVAVDGVNALLPVDAAFTDETRRNLRGGLAVDGILEEMRKRAGSSLLFLDACRSNLDRGFEAVRPADSAAADGDAARSASRAHDAASGPANDGPKLGGFYYVYAAAPNRTAADGEGNHSPFTRAFLDNATTPGRIVQELVSDITRAVIKAAPGQIPYADGSLSEEVFLNGEMSEREISLRSDSHATRSALLREQGFRGGSVAEALKGLSCRWGETEGVALPVGRARAELFRAYDSHNVVLATNSEVLRTEFDGAGRVLLTLEGDGARVWDVETGFLRAFVEIPGVQPIGVSLSRDGRGLAIAWETGLRLVDLATMTVSDFKVLPKITSLAFSPDGSRLAMTSADGNIRLISIKIGNLSLVSEELLKNLEVVSSWPAEKPIAVAFDPRGERLAVGTENGKAEIRDARSGAVLTTMTGHNGSVVDVEFGPDGNTLLTASLDGTARLWSIHSAQPVSTLPSDGAWLISASFSADGGRVVTSSESKSIKVWNRTDSSVIRTMTGNGLSNAIHSPTEDKIAYGAARDGARIESLNPDGLSRSFTADYGEFDFADFLVSGDALVRHSQNGLSVCDREDGRCRRIPQAIGAPDLSADGSKLLIATGSGAEIWNVPEFKLARRIAPDRHFVAAAISRDGRYVVGDTIARDFDPMSRLRAVWDGAGGGRLGTIEVAYPRKFTFGGDLMAALTGGSVVVVWNARTRAEIGITGVDGGYDALSLSNDGKRGAVGGEKGFRMFDGSEPESGRNIDSLPGAGSVTAVAFSRYGDRLVTGFLRDGRFAVWDTLTGQLLEAIDGHDGTVAHASFDHKDEQIITASRTAKIWDAGLYGPELLDAAYALITDEQRAEVARERIRYFEIDPELTQ